MQLRYPFQTYNSTCHNLCTHTQPRTNTDKPPTTTKTTGTKLKLHGLSASLVQSPRKNHPDSKYPWMKPTLTAFKICLHSGPNNITPKRVQFDMTLLTSPAPRFSAALRACNALWDPWPQKIFCHRQIISPRPQKLLL